MKSALRGALGVLVWAVAAGAGAATPAPWTLPLLTAAEIAPRCASELAAVRGMLRTMERAPAPGAILAEWNRFSSRASDFGNAVYLQSSVATDAATREAALKCVETLTPLETEAFQSEKLYRRVRALKPADAIDRQYRQDLLEAFEDAGVTLPPAKRARVKAIRDELDTLSLRFESVLNEDKSAVPMTLEQVKGLPQAWIEARKHDPEGRLIVTVDTPTFTAFMENAVDADARKALYVARLRRGGEANLAALARVLALRYELAQIYGYPDFATFVLRRAAAKTPAAVNAFLAQVKGAVDEVEARELDEVRADKAAFLGKPVADVKLDRWDLAFHSERIKRARFAIDQEALRAYFPTDASLAFAMRIAEKLYGIEFAARDVPRWADDVRYFDVFERKADGKRGGFIGGVYIDIFPREGKYGHAAAFPLRMVSTLTGRKPASALVANLSRTGLTYDELETVMHEFGHVLHGVLSTARYADQGGTNVKRDFVEAPSQMFEEWGRRPETLAVFAEVCPACPRLSAAQIEQLDKARLFGVGTLYARQWQYASFDMRIHTGAPPDPMQTWTDIERSSRLGSVDGTLFPAGFGHLVGGYAAGYYGYMWSQVWALDMLAGFHGKLLDPVAGRRYRSLVLAQGRQKPPGELVEAFLGRKPNPDAFFAEITGRRN